MHTTNNIPTRNKVSSSETWDLTDLFLDFNQWEEKLNSLPTENQLEELMSTKFKGKLGQSSELLLECIKYRDEITRVLESLYVYANLRQCEDLEDSEASEKCGKIEGIMSSIQAQFSFIEPEMLLIPSLLQWSKEAPLNQYRFQIEELIRQKSHVLTEKEEAILSRLQVPLNNFDSIHSKWNNADLKFTPALDKDGNEHVVSHSRYSSNLQSKDRILRVNTVNSFYSEISKWRHTITQNYFGNMVAGSSIAQIRNFKGYLEASLFGDDIPVDLYDNLIKYVRSNLNLLHRSMELRKKVLKLDAIAPHDRMVSLYEGQEQKFSWEEGRDLVLEAIKPLGQEYVEIARKGLTTERWIDRAENQGKRSGAFSWGCYDSKPYMLQSWTGTLSDVYTLAHELGHSMHSYYSRKNQSYHNASYTIFVAEVASTLNEALLTEYILNHKAGTSLAQRVVSETLQNFEGTVLRQVLFATFEREIAQISDRGEAFTPDKLEEIYFALNKEWYGSHGSYPDYIKYEWMRIPHFYSAFYVYKYATSYCASLALCEKLKNNPEEGQSKIFDLLKAGGSKSSLEILKDAGIDFLTPMPVSNAFQNYEKNIDLAAKTFA